MHNVGASTFLTFTAFVTSAQFSFFLLQFSFKKKIGKFMFIFFLELYIVMTVNSDFHTVFSEHMNISKQLWLKWILNWGIFKRFTGVVPIVYEENLKDGSIFPHSLVSDWDLNSNLIEVFFGSSTRFMINPPKWKSLSNFQDKSKKCAWKVCKFSIYCQTSSV